MEIKLLDDIYFFIIPSKDQYDKKLNSQNVNL